MNRLTEIMSRLRGEGGCPWDREQTLESLKQYLVEECYELLDAIDSGDPRKHKDELGDLLLQVLFQSQIRSEQGHFTFDDVADTLAEKLVRRHPHVFGDEHAETSEQVLRRWEEIKAGEKPEHSRRSMLDGIPRHLPALLKAQRVQTRAARVGFDWAEVGGVLDKIREELGEAGAAIRSGDAGRIRDEIGDLLFAAVNLSRFLGVNSEHALETATRRFVERFGRLEERIRKGGRKMTDATPAELDAHWEAVKAELGGSSLRKLPARSRRPRPSSGRKPRRRLSVRKH